MRSFNRSTLFAVVLALVLFAQATAAGHARSLVKCQNPAQCSIQRA